MQTTTKSRLAAYRAQAAKYPTSDGWRYWYYLNTFATPNNVRTDKGAILSDALDQYGDYMGSVDKLSPRNFDHTGWYADNFHDSLIVGGVCRMRCPRGTLYIPVTHCSGWGGVIHYVNDAELAPKGASEDKHDIALREAARSADYYAEREAEESREDDAKYQAERQIEEARETIHKINAACLPLLRDIKGRTFPVSVCTALRDRVAEYLRDRSEQFETIDNLSADYWAACPDY